MTSGLGKQRMIINLCKLQTVLTICSYLGKLRSNAFISLRDTVRSSLYNLSPRSPRSMKRKFSSQATTPNHSPHQSRSVSSPEILNRESTPITSRRKKGPPPPLDLSSLSAFHTKAQIKTAQRKFIGKSDKHKKESEQDKRMQYVLEKDIHDDDAHVTQRKTPRKITLKGILRSVRSISSMRSSQ